MPSVPALDNQSCTLAHAPIRSSATATRQGCAFRRLPEGFNPCPASVFRGVKLPSWAAGMLEGVPWLTQKRKCCCLAITASKAGRTRPPGQLDSAFAPLLSHAAALFRWGLSRRRNVAGSSNCTPSTTPCGVTGSYRPKKSPLYPTTNEGRDWWNGPSDFRQGQTCRGRPRPHGPSRVRGMAF